jgi:hypothetical protein
MERRKKLSENLKSYDTLLLWYSKNICVKNNIFLIVTWCFWFVSSYQICTYKIKYSDCNYMEF